MGKIISWLLVFGFMFVLSGCKTISDTAQYHLSKPVNCSEAQYDIQMLEAEKASVAKQAMAGVRSITPAGAIIGLLTGEYKNGVQVATGKYNKDLDAKIREIKDSCGIQ
jgi:hypothetical protein